ncbi:MAG: DUF4139 domain-containing protein [Sphingomonadaceae bacterium]|nr:DUF4139 domain-containing protein [Sphingomonadaceae bacterium]
MRRLLMLSAAAVPGLAFAQAQGDVSVTIYNNDLALVQDVRQVALQSGRTRVEFPDVSGRIRPETVTLAGAGMAIVEQNFDYDLLTPAKLMEEAVGETVTLVRTNPATGAETREQATILAVNGGVVMRIGQRIEILRDDALPVRVIFAEVPPNLRARPTLSVTLASESAGTRPATLSYLTNGMSWAADYVAMFDRAAGTIDVQGWITLNNTTGTSFVNADTVLVAGSPETSFGQVYDGRRREQPRNVRRAGTETADREMVGDYYLYPLAERTTIADRQTKQVSFLDVTGAPARNAYEFRAEWMQNSDEPISASSVLQFSNAREGGLGDALPAGTVRVYMRDSQGQPQFIGENVIGHTPMGSDLAITTGLAFDVQVQPTVQDRVEITETQWRETARLRIDDRVAATIEYNVGQTFYRTTMRYALTNARPEPVTIDLIQTGLDRGWRDTRLFQTSLDPVRRSWHEVAWRVSVPANGETILTATFDTRY